MKLKVIKDFYGIEEKKNFKTGEVFECNNEVRIQKAIEKGFLEEIKEEAEKGLSKKRGK